MLFGQVMHNVIIINKDLKMQKELLKINIPNTGKLNGIYMMFHSHRERENLLCISYRMQCGENLIAL